MKDPHIDEYPEYPCKAITAHTLEVKRFHFAVRISCWEVERVQRSATDALFMHLHCYMASKHIENYVFKAPADWWQAVKERFATAWFLERWPVKYRTENIDAIALYPEIPLAKREPFIVIAEPSHE